MVRGKSKSLALAAAAAALFCSAPAHANLVTNGDFETGDFTGWTTSLGAFDGVDTFAPQAGSYAAFFGNVSGSSTISQTLATQSGSTYEVTFWLMNEADPSGATTPNSFEFDWGGSAVTTLTNAGAFGYTQYDFLVYANSSSTDLTFQFMQTPAFWDFDSVNVVLHVPEPDTFALAALAGVLGLTLSGRRALARRRGTPASA